MHIDHPGEDLVQLRADAVTAVQAFHAERFPRTGQDVEGRGIDS
jgi:hypothetical protein